MNPSTNYTPTENGFLNTCSQEYFNRLLYGSHANDDKEDKFATFAGDVPQFMGSAIDWTVHDWCDFGKRGTLSSGLCGRMKELSEMYDAQKKDILSLHKYLNQYSFCFAKNIISQNYKKHNSFLKEIWNEISCKMEKSVV